MRVELIPIILGVLVGLLGLGLLYDAWAPDELTVRHNRRRRLRVERSRAGEATIGAGVLCMAAAFLGRDNWGYSVLAVILGAALLVGGAIANRSYLRALVENRGALRRRGLADPPALMDSPESTEANKAASSGHAARRIR